MKSRTFLFSTFILCGFSVYGQLFAPMNSKWTFVAPDVQHLSCQHNTGYSYFEMEVVSQRMVQGKTMNVLTSGDEEILICEDSSRVYFFENDSLFLLMDFSLTVGDTLTHSLPSNADHFRKDGFCCCQYDSGVPLISVVWKDTFIIAGGRMLKQLRFITYISDTIALTGQTYYRESAITFTERIGGTIFDGPLKECCLADVCCPSWICYEDDEIFYLDAAVSNTCVLSANDSVRMENTSSHFFIYPNPTRDLVHVSIPKYAVAHITISDIYGKILIQTSQTEIVVSNLPEGLYFLNAGLINGGQFGAKFFVR